VILSHWLSEAGHTLTDAQYDSIVKTYADCPNPLFLRCCFHEALSWTSYTLPEQYKLAAAIKRYNPPVIPISALFVDVPICMDDTLSWCKHDVILISCGFLVLRIPLSQGNRIQTQILMVVSPMLYYHAVPLFLGPSMN